MDFNRWRPSFDNARRNRSEDGATAGASGHQVPPDIQVNGGSVREIAQMLDNNLPLGQSTSANPARTPFSRSHSNPDLVALQTRQRSHPLIPAPSPDSYARLRGRSRGSLSILGTGNTSSQQHRRSSPGNSIGTFLAPFIQSPRPSSDLLRSGRPATGRPSETTASHALHGFQVNVEDEHGRKSNISTSTTLRDLASKINKVKDFCTMLESRTKNTLDFVAQVSGDAFDLTMLTCDSLGLGSEGLCTACSKIPFHEYQPHDPSIITQSEMDETTFYLPLNRLLRNRGWCKLCRLLYQTLSRPESDPLKHPAVQEFIQEDFKGKSFHEWASMQTLSGKSLFTQDSWPFGHSRDSPDTRLDIGTWYSTTEDLDQQRIEVDAEYRKANRETQDPEARADGIVGAAVVGTMGIRAAIAPNSKHSQVFNILDGVLHSLALFAAISKRPRPVYVVIKFRYPSHKLSGLLTVNVLGYGRKGPKSYRTDLSCISHFNLRIGSDFSRVDGSPDVRYGCILDQHKINLQQMKRCYEHCRDSHGERCSSPFWSCQSLPSEIAQFRLFDVFEERLVLADSQKPPPYVCLSYVWGRQAGITLERGNVQLLTTEGALLGAEISQTIRDAMDVTKQMNIRYLWVDRLCIVQDNEADKRPHIKQMDRIYGNAVFTIVAADSPHANHGITGISSARHPGVEQIVEEVHEGVKVMVPVVYKSNLAPWNSRAWTLQEKLLSRRVLVFNERKVRFECRRETFHEDMTAQDAGVGNSSASWITLPEDGATSMSQVTLNNNGSLRLKRSAVFAEYTRLVESYTQRHMSDPSDALKAFEGLLRVLEQSRPAQPPSQPSPLTFHGLPDEFLDLALLWQPAAGDCVSLRRRQVKDIPSWSWAAWEAVPSKHSSCCDDTHHKDCIIYEGGVRYERPFKVLADNHGALRKGAVTDDDAEERMLPITRWHRWLSNAPPVPPNPFRSPYVQSTGFSHLDPRISTKDTATPVPINGNGLGLAMQPSDDLPLDWVHPCMPLDPKSYQVCRNNTRYLIFQTQIARFRLGNTNKREERFWHGDTREKTATFIHETEILDSQNLTIGRVILPERFRQPQGNVFDFIIISRGQYFGDEDSVGARDYPLFNVMMIEWDEQRIVASRLALGRIYARSWQQARPQERVVILG